MDMFDEYEPDLKCIALNILNEFIVITDAKVKSYLFRWRNRIRKFLIQKT